MGNKGWTIFPLLLATAEVDRSQGLLNRDVGVKMKGGILAFLLKKGRKNILVDTGASGLTPTREFSRYFDQTPDQTLSAELARLNTSFEEITTVVNTHLHIDHCSGNVFFKKARFLVQTRELDYWRSPLRVHREAYRVELSERSFDALNGDADIDEGVKVISTPGHSPGSQSVLVETSEGLYILPGDTIPHFENMAVPDGEPFWPTGIYVSLDELYESFKRLSAMKGVILPAHDLEVMKKHAYP
ncbi:MAG TPA: N-acyl homoserine lactonase family protein [Syntrophorhabdaceae bacterium]|nr:N-acyl homoserine lactonase family protein [Syntrophorhabdaceae bacterium]